MLLTDKDRGARVHATRRRNGGIRIAQGPAEVYLDAAELLNLRGWLASIEGEDRDG